MKAKVVTGIVIVCLAFLAISMAAAEAQKADQQKNPSTSDLAPTQKAVYALAEEPKEPKSIVRGLGGQADKLLGDVGAKLEMFRDKLISPEQINPDVWADLAAGAAEAVEKVRELKRIREEVLEDGIVAKAIVGDARTGLGSVRSRFAGLIQQGEDALTGSNPPLPEALAEATKAVIESDRLGLRACDSVILTVSQIIEAQRDSLITVDRSKDLLDHLEASGLVYLDLAAAGGKAAHLEESLKSYASRINNVIRLFEELGERAMSEAQKLTESPAPSPSA